MSVGLAKANAGLAQLRRSGPQARQALNAVEIGARQLAFQATGLAGGLGQVARGLLLFGGGSALMLGVIAGLGAVGLAYKALTGASREAKKEQDEFAKSLRATGAAGAALAERMKLRELEIELEPKIRGAMMAGATRQEAAALFPESRAIATQRIVVANAERRAAEATAAQRERIADAAERELKAVRERLAAEGREFLRIMGGRRAFLAGEIPGLGVAATQPARPVTAERERAALVSIGAFVPELRLPDPERVRRRIQEAERQAAIARGGVIADMERPRFEFGAAQAMALANIPLATQAGGVGGFLGGAGGFLSTLQGVNPLIGAGLGIAGSLFGMLDRSEERRTDRIVNAINRMAEEVGLERVTVVFTGPDGHQVRKSLAELESGDAVERIPVPVGATG